MLYNGQTDVGMKRQVNQDNFKTIPIWGGEATLLVVCDGMGGHKAGDIASKTAAQAFCNTIFRQSAPTGSDDAIKAEIKMMMVSASDAANVAVYKLAQTSEDYEGMGTTLVAALIYKNSLFAVNIGDSRLYLVTKLTAIQISHDHSFVQYLIDSGKLTEEEAKTYPRRNVITRAIGVAEQAEVDFFTADLAEWDGGYLLLCSDGLSNYTDGQFLFDTLYGNGPKDDETEEELTAKVSALIAHANECGGADNITAVVARF